MSRVIIFLFIVLFLSSCKKEKEEPADLLLSYEGNFLTLSEVESKIPQGLPEADSLSLFKSIIDNWIKDMVLTEFAESHLMDLNAIDRKVKDYRNNLIINEYLSRLKESRQSDIDSRKVKEYYDAHRQELKLEVPLVKGIFLKINNNSPGKEEIKKLMESKDDESIDKLEQEWLDRALEYNYFRDKWIDWPTISSIIPYRFGDPTEMLEKNRFFETEYGDCVYYLQISDYLPEGNEQPYEFAAQWISGLLNQTDQLQYETDLVNSLMTKSIKEHKLEIRGYDPLRHEMLYKSVKEYNEDNDKKKN